MSERTPILIIRALGPRTEGHRIGLADLLAIGKHVQAAVERVALVLAGQSHSARPGRKPKEISEECALEVVAMPPGSFAITLDLPRERFDLMDPGVQAVQHLLAGLEHFGDDAAAALPAGYDNGVLHSLRDLGKVLNGQLTSLEICGATDSCTRTVSYTRAVVERVDRRIKGPVRNSRSIEGRLLMADFGPAQERCRVHPAIGDPVSCVFDDDMEESVHELLRGQVRVTGEATEDPNTGRIRSIRIADIEPVTLEDKNFTPIIADDFWKSRDLDALAAEQGVMPITDLSEVLGGAAELWDDDEDFEEFLAATSGRAGK